MTAVLTSGVFSIVLNENSCFNFLGVLSRCLLSLHSLNGLSFNCLYGAYLIYFYYEFFIESLL